MYSTYWIVAKFNYNNQFVFDFMFKVQFCIAITSAVHLFNFSCLFVRSRVITLYSFSLPAAVQASIVLIDLCYVRNVLNFCTAFSIISFPRGLHMSTRISCPATDLLAVLSVLNH